MLFSLNIYLWTIIVHWIWWAADSWICTRLTHIWFQKITVSNRQKKLTENVGEHGMANQNCVEFEINKINETYRIRLMKLDQIISFRRCFLRHMYSLPYPKRPIQKKKNRKQNTDKINKSTPWNLNKTVELSGDWTSVAVSAWLLLQTSSISSNGCVSVCTHKNSWLQPIKHNIYKTWREDGNQC